ncbi:uncharacterized protein LOC111334905 [Paramuricea clavata]|uniref:Uncharacterized protein LOC111334905 n=1 Tax=Paramuricea clavata TaxID=317549 RepID=A0A6S7ILI1_PARCT|nr:uncharacterized protein LOC111334905 [Paramuricea clavata]
MPSARCVVQECSNVSNLGAGISLHRSPADKTEYGKWLRFVRTHRANFNPKGVFVICSRHFREECFDGIHMKGSRRKLQPLSIPTIWKKEPQKPLSERNRRKVINEILSGNAESSQNSTSFGKENYANRPINTPMLVQLYNQIHTSTSLPFLLSDVPVLSTDDDNNQSTDNMFSEIVPEKSEEVRMNTAPCNNCKILRKKKKDLQRKLRAMHDKVDNLNQKITSNQKDWINTFEQLSQRPVMVETDTQTCDEEDESGFADQLDDMDDLHSCEDVNENIVQDDDQPWTPDQSDNVYEKLGEDDYESLGSGKDRLKCEGKDVREEPKGILSITQTGTMLTVKSACSSCGGTHIWKSQPYMLGKFPAGNILLSFAILSAGASVGKIILVFKHMGLLCYSEATYYYHQRHLLFPSIVKFWQTYQDNILKSLNRKDVVLAGDARHDSMGHSAKYGGYTIFCCTVGLIIHIVIIQANQAGNSNNMEFLGHQKALAFLLGTGMIIKAFISDRHLAITKWMREDCPKKCKELQKPIIEHYFDLWHIGKSHCSTPSLLTNTSEIRKVLTKLSKENGCEVIVAKFKAFFHHVLNIHHDLPNKIFNKCAHGPSTTQRVWLTKGSDEYEKLVANLSKTSLLNGIKNASPIAQTSCLEGYHSVVNQFTPKMLAYSHTGILCRTIPAATHFNYNLRRQSKVDMDGNVKLKVTYPKFKEGEATVREVKVVSNYDYVAEIYKTMTTMPKKELKTIEDKLKKDTPEALHNMLPERENKEEAKNKYKFRKTKVTVVCPPTCSDAELQDILHPPTATCKRKAPMCRKCGKPRKGHKKGQCSGPISAL